MAVVSVPAMVMLQASCEMAASVRVRVGDESEEEEAVAILEKMVLLVEARVFWMAIWPMMWRRSLLPGRRGSELGNDLGRWRWSESG